MKIDRATVLMGNSAKVCLFVSKECYFCKNKGHIEKVCRKKVNTKKPHQMLLLKVNGHPQSK